MKTRFGFTLMLPAEFNQWIKNQQVGRTVRVIQQHHTWKPSYQNFDGQNHFEIQNGMKNTHIGNNGWIDIGQHFTIFPDGQICTGRGLENSPAGIYMNNANAICIENLGNFDEGGDNMTHPQADAIVDVTASLCKRFNLPIDSTHIVYHHWFSYAGVRNDGAGSNKSCPGTKFFGGNKVADFNQNFKPLVLNKMQTNPTGGMPLSLVKMVYVIAGRLHVRTGPGTNFEKKNTIEIGSILRVYDEKDLWLKISQSQEEWVFGRYTVDVQLGNVTASTLNVRSGPGTNFPKVFSLQKGQEVAIMETVNDWHRIGMNDIWVSSSFVMLK